MIVTINGSVMDHVSSVASDGEWLAVRFDDLPGFVYRKHVAAGCPQMLVCRDEAELAAALYEEQYEDLGHIFIASYGNRNYCQRCGQLRTWHMDEVRR